MRCKNISTIAGFVGGTGGHEQGDAGSHQKLEMVRKLVLSSKKGIQSVNTLILT
jgi:hypothetical protein